MICVQKAPTQIAIKQVANTFILKGVSEARNVLDYHVRRARETRAT
jgi:hypothetical protein